MKKITRLSLMTLALAMLAPSTAALAAHSGATLAAAAVAGHSSYAVACLADGVKDLPTYPNLTEDMLLGSWAHDQGDGYTDVMEFFYEDGVLCYYYYTAGDFWDPCNGIKYGTWDYSAGHVYPYFFHGTCDCAPVYHGEEDRSHGIPLLVSQMDQGILINQLNGNTFQKVSDQRLTSEEVF